MNLKIALTSLILLACLGMQAQKTQKIPKIGDTYTPSKNKMYKKGWIDFNKNGKMDVYENPNANINDRIEDLLSQMNVDEKTAQMVTLYGYKRVLKDDLPTPGWKNELWKDGVGAIDEHLNGFQQWGLPPSDNPYVWPASRHAWALNEVQRFFLEETRLGIPTDFTNEGIRGVESYMATNFPSQIGLGHTWNRDLIHKVGEITGQEARLLGYTNIYAPILDVGRDQRWGRYEEIYGESPYLVAEMGVQMAKGMQKDMKVASTAKHYVAYANNKGAREGMSRVDPQMSPREVEMIHVYPFKRVIKEAGILGVMSSYNDYDGFPIQSSHYWLTDRLRGEMGFIGYVVSDSDAVEYLYSKHKTAKDMKEAIYQSVMAGLNVRCTFRSTESYVYPLRELIAENRISMDVINDRVRDILRVKFMVGMFDRPYQINLAEADKVVNGEENQKAALQASRESIVLLKNENNTLPLDINKVKKIAISGPNANEKSYALTHYGPLAVEVSTVLDGIKQITNGKAEVLYTKGCDLVDANWPESEIIDYPLTDIEQADIDKAVAQAKQADVAVVVLGGGARTCGENKSRSDIILPGKQLDLLKAVQATGKPVVLVLINGRPLAINWAEKFTPAILETWYPGSQGGTAIAEVLFGDYNPGGKLTVTFPKSVGQIPFNFPTKPNAQVDGGRTPGVKGNQSRVNGALYYFGYGLSYTTFEYSDLKFSAKSINAGENVELTCKVKNTGSREGDEVVQVYLRDLLSSVTTYEKNLVGFERVNLKAGETKTVKFTIHARDMQLLDINNNWVIEPGDFKVMVGASSEKILLSDNFTVKSSGTEQTVKAEGNSNIVASANVLAKDNIFDRKINTVWEAKQGDHITISLDGVKAVRSLQIAWASKSDDLSFEIQASSGGGQFLTVYTGESVNQLKEYIHYEYNETTASDIRIVITKGNGAIAEVMIPEN